VQLGVAMGEILNNEAIICINKEEALGQWDLTQGAWSPNFFLLYFYVRSNACWVSPIAFLFKAEGLG